MGFVAGFLRSLEGILGAILPFVVWAYGWSPGFFTVIQEVRETMAVASEAYLGLKDCKVVGTSPMTRSRGGRFTGGL